MEAIWRVEMLGALCARGEEQVVTRFRTRRVAVLLAFLAFYRNRLHFRDEVGEMLWQEGDPEVIRRNLRQALLSLRHAVEPPPIPSGAILQVNQSRLQLNPELVTTDVHEFEDHIARARDSKSVDSRFKHLKAAVDLYKGELLPGFNEDWIVGERLRLEDLYVSSLGRLIEQCETSDRTDEAIHYLRLALAKEPLTEQWHASLMRLYIKSGRPASALKQYADLEKTLSEQLNCEPDEESRKLAARARQEASLGRMRSKQKAEAPRDDHSPVHVDEELAPKSTARLPVQLTRLYGRRNEIDVAKEQLLDGRTRLLTILGPAGTGKTRLSIEVGRTLADTGWNVWFVPLADVDDGTHLPDRVLDILRPQKAAEGDPVEAISAALGDSPTLLILDNLEHIVEESAPLVARLIEALPNLSCIATSRQSLKISGESEFPLGPLPIPSQGAENDYSNAEQLAQLAEFPSVQLFVDRCQAVRPDVQLTPNNAKHFATICAKLEGIPLAIEIAAGLSNAFTPAQMVKHLDNRLAALTSRRRDIVPRHRSVRVAIEYSYAFLAPRLQDFFASLSVFRGGFTVESAYDVCYRWLNEDASPAGKVKRNVLESCLGMILDLQERSLLRSDELVEGADLRFRLLETFREFGEECLSEADYDTLCQRHAAHYLESLLKEDPSDAESRGRLHERITAEYDNCLAALEYLLGRGQVEASIKLLGALSTVWDLRGTKVAERNAIRMIAVMDAFQDVEPTARIHLLRMLGTTYLRNSEFLAAYQACADALEVAKQTGRDDLIASCTFGMSLCAGFLGRPEHCLELCDQVLKHAPAQNAVLLERTYVSIGSARWVLGEIPQAEAAFQQARQISQGFRNGEPDPLILAHLAGIYLDQARFDEAMVAAGEGIRLSRRIHNEISLSACLSVVGRYHRLKGNLDAAVATNHEALLKGRDIAISAYCMEVLRGHALILAELGADEEAVSLIAATQGLSPIEKKGDRQDTDRALKTLRSRLDAARFERAWARGLTMDIDDAFHLALRFK